MKPTSALMPILGVLTGSLCAPLWAQESTARPASLEACLALASDTARLACYDQASGYIAPTTEQADQAAVQAHGGAVAGAAQVAVGIAERDRGDARAARRDPALVVAHRLARGDVAPLDQPGLHAHHRAQRVRLADRRCHAIEGGARTHEVEVVGRAEEDPG